MTGLELSRNPAVGVGWERRGEPRRRNRSTPLQGIWGAATGIPLYLCRGGSITVAYAGLLCTTYAWLHVTFIRFVAMCAGLWSARSQTWFSMHAPDHSRELNRSTRHFYYDGQSYFKRSMAANTFWNTGRFEIMQLETATLYYLNLYQPRGQVAENLDLVSQGFWS